MNIRPRRNIKPSRTRDKKAALAIDSEPPSLRSRVVYGGRQAAAAREWSLILPFFFTLPPLDGGQMG